MRRIAATLPAALLAVAVLGGPALAATPDEAVAGLSDGLYVEGGTEFVDTDRVRASIERAAAGGLQLSVIVLADPSTSTITFAGEANDLQSGTILVFTTAEYGASSDELSQNQLDAALAASDDALSGPNVAAGVDAFVDAAMTEASSTNWGLILAGIAVVLLVVGVGGRIFERRATAGRRDRALRRHWAELQDEADGLSDSVLELSTKTQLDGSPELLSAFRAVSNGYGDIQTRLGREPSEQAADAITTDLAALSTQITDLERSLEATG